MPDELEARLRDAAAAWQRSHADVPTLDTFLRGAVAVLDEPADAATAAVGPNPPVSRRSRWRPVAAVAGAAASVVALAVGAAVLTHGSHHAPPPALAATIENPCRTIDKPTLTGLSVDASILGATPVLAVRSCAGEVTAALYSNSAGALGGVKLYAPGLFDPRSLVGARQVTEHGVHGWWQPDAPAVPCPTPQSPSATCAQRPQFAWQYAPDAWGVVEQEGASPVFHSDPLLQAATIAAATAPQSAPPRVPFRLTDLPAQLRLYRAGGPVDSPDNRGSSQGGLVELGQPGIGTDCERDAVCAATVTVSVVPIGDNATSGPTVVTPSSSTHTASGGRVDVLPGPYDGQRAVTMQRGHWQVTATTPVTSTVTDADLVGLVQGMRLAPSYTDVSTWFPAGDASPR